MAANKNKGLKKGTLDFLLSSSNLNSNLLVSTKPELQKKTETEFSDKLDEVIIQSSKNKTESSKPKKVSSSSELQYLAIEKIHKGKYQPRSNFSESALQELASSIKEQGVIQPILVRSSSQGFEIIAGERRFRAAQLAGLTKIPAIIQNIPLKSYNIILI